MSEGTIPVLWLCGPTGVGKTTVGWEIYSQVIGSGVEAAYVDIDQLGICYPEPASDPGRHRMKARNAAAVVANFQDADARCVVVSGVVDPALGVPMDELPDADLTVCGLRVDPGELRRRLAARGAPAEQVEELLREAEEMDGSAIADVWVDSSGLSVGEVAELVRKRAGGWPPSAGRSRPPERPTGQGADASDGPILWLCGPTGVGKSAVGFAVYQEVLRAGVMAAYVDVDQLGLRGPTPADHRLRASNLAAVWRTFREFGADGLVAVGPVEDETAVGVYADALPGAAISWCRLHAGRDRLTERILQRGQGRGWRQPGDPLRGRPSTELLRVAEDAATEAAALERSSIGLRIDTDGRTVEDLADSVLAQSGWLAGLGGEP